jgi:hypothetical protein
MLLHAVKPFSSYISIWNANIASKHMVDLGTVARGIISIRTDQGHV